MSDIMTDYKPVRVIQDFSISCTTREELKGKYPNAEFFNKLSKGAFTETVSGIYKRGKVIDAPTDHERVLFDALSDNVVVNIPQHKDGYDNPNSNIARSRKASYEGRQKYLRTVASREMTTTKPKADKSVKSNKEVEV